MQPKIILNMPITKTVPNMPRLIKLLLVHMFFDGFVPITAFYAIMFSRVGGLDVAQIGTLFAVWGLSYVLLEIPSGVLADYWSRKWLLFASGILRAIGFGVWLVWPGFTGYAIGFALWGATIACWSGAAAAYLHDELAATNRANMFSKYFGQLMAINTFGKLCGLLVAAAVTLSYPEALIVMSIVSSLALSVPFLFLPEHPYDRQKSYIKTFAAAVSELKRSPLLQYLSVVLFCIYMTIGVIEEFTPRIYSGFGLSDRFVAVLIGVSVLGAALALTRMDKISSLRLGHQLFGMCLGLITLLVGLYLGGLIGGISILGFTLVFEVFRPVFMHHVTATAAGNERATVGSIPGFFGGLLGAFAYWLIGFAGEMTTEARAVALYAGFFLMVFVLLSVVSKRHRFAKEKSDNSEIPPVNFPNPLGH